MVQILLRNSKHLKRNPSRILDTYYGATNTYSPMLSVRLHLRRVLPGPRRPRHDIRSNERSISTGTCVYIRHRYGQHVLFERSCTEATFRRWQPVPHIARRRARSCCVARSISSHRVPVEEKDCEEEVTSAKVKPAQRQEDVTTSPPTRHSTNRKDDSDGKNNSPQLKEEEEVETTTVIRRLASLARPEWNLILGAAATLGITSTVTLVLPYASGQVLDLAIDAASSGDDPSSSTFSPAAVAAGLFGLTAVAGIGVYARSLLLTTAGNRIVSRMRRRLFAAAVSQDVAFFDRTGTGDLISRLSADAQLVQAAVTTQAVGALRGVVMSAGSSALLFYTSPTLAVASLASLPPVFVAARYFGARLRERQARVQEMHAGATSVAEEVFRGIRTVRQFAAEEREVDRYGEAVRAAHDEAVRAGRAQAAFDATVHVAANGAILGVLGYGGTMVLSGTLSAGDLAGFLMYSLLVAGNVSSLSSTYAEFMKAAAASGRIFSVIDRVPEIPPAFSVDDVADRDPGAVGGAAEGFLDADTVCNEARSSPSHHVVPLSVEFRNVVFAYPTRPGVSVLNNFSLDIRPGEVVAIVGVSGGGKSTVASLLTRLYDVADGPKADAVDDVGGGGGVFVDGKDIRALDPRWLRTNIGVVAQEPLLFAGTIFDNIKYGRWSATDGEVREAARVAHVTAFADALPDGLYTCVGQGGTQLSGGQRQRVAIGRTVLKDPPIVVLDEATSALDAESERHIHEAISTVMRGRTVISIAHRLSTIREADRIAVLQDGTVVEDGKFEELLSREGGLFVDLMGKQITR